VELVWIVINTTTIQLFHTILKIEL
jgi:hypothetical protein